MGFGAHDEDLYSSGFRGAVKELGALVEAQ